MIDVGLWVWVVSRIWWQRDGGLWVWVVVSRGAVDQHDGFAFVEVCHGGFGCVCVCFAWCLLAGVMCLPLCLSSFFSPIWVL